MSTTTKAKTTKKSTKKAAGDPDRVPLTEAIAKKPKKEAKPKKMSCLDAAAQVLKDKGEPMNCKGMIDAMSAATLWSSDAPTPAATLSSAILREMNVKKRESRFKKTGRGLFALN